MAAPHMASGDNGALVGTVSSNPRSVELALKWPRRFGQPPKNGRAWRNRLLQPKTAFSRFPPVHRLDPEGLLRVVLTRSSRRPGMPGMCAKETAGVGVKLLAECERRKWDGKRA
jgi:hypothetical protein